MRIRILAEAEQDFADGFAFYESQATGLGSRFVECLLADIDRLTQLPNAHPMHFGYRRLLATRFPFAIYFKSDSERDAIDIMAVLDCRQHPERIADRLR